ncbi:hypothetical protein [Streptacidiphilus sp. EB103A]|uniref:hypothetical protein n=1 Tax=Streptacidiphilus sp. EB103A TaxID=3156275 RepID=UPI00351103F8
MLATRRLKRSLELMPLPVPFTIEGLIANMSQQSGRHIELVELGNRNTDLRTACGLRARLGETTYILYRPRPTPNQTLHTQLHELVHEWFDHGTTLTREEMRELLPPELLHEVDALATGALVQARARYEDPEEQVAELSALLLKDMIRTQEVGDDMVSLLETTLAHPVARRRTKNNPRGI